MARIHWATVVTLGLLLAKNPASAAESNRTESLLLSAYSLYAELDFEQTIPVLEQALRVPFNSRSQLIRIFHLKGLCLSSLGKTSAAQEAFYKLLLLDPDFRIGPEVSPWVRKPFDELLFKKLPGLSFRIKAPANILPDKPIIMNLHLTSDPLKMARSIRVWVGTTPKKAYSSMDILLSNTSRIDISIPTQLWAAPRPVTRVFWYAKVETDYHGEIQSFGTAQHPNIIKVLSEPTTPTPLLAPTQVSPWYTRWWVWALIGTAAAAATTTAVVLTSSEPASGPFDFTVDYSTSPP